MSLGALGALSVVGFGSPAPAADRVQCFNGGGYLVIARERAGGAGTDLLVRKRASDAKAACTYQRTAGDFELADPSKPYSFKDIRSDFLILTEPTGPTRNVVVFDLTTHRKMLDLTSDDVKIDDRGILLWARTDKGTPETCRTFAQIKNDGLVPVIETKARFIFAESRLFELKVRRCVGAQ